MDAQEEIIFCNNCKKVILDEEKVSVFQGKEEIVTGYKCSCCGHNWGE